MLTSPEHYVWYNATSMRPFLKVFFKQLKRTHWKSPSLSAAVASSMFFPDLFRADFWVPLVGPTLKFKVVALIFVRFPVTYPVLGGGSSWKHVISDAWTSVLGPKDRTARGPVKKTGPLEARSHHRSSSCITKLHWLPSLRQRGISWTWWGNFSK